MPIVTENFDGVTAPNLPAAWTFGAHYRTSTATAGITPTSSPNMLQLPAVGTPGSSFAVYDTPDANGGDTSVRCNLNGSTDSPSHDLQLGIIARASSPSVTASSGTFYWIQWDIAAAQVSLFAVVAGAPTSIDSFTFSPALPDWMQFTFTPVGSSLTLTIQQLATGFWWNPTGGFQAGFVAALSLTDSSVAGAGYAGIAMDNRSETGVFADDFIFSAVAASIPTLPAWPWAGRLRDGEIRRIRAAGPRQSSTFVPRPAVVVPRIEAPPPDRSRVPAVDAGRRIRPALPPLSTVVRIPRLVFHPPDVERLGRIDRSRYPRPPEVPPKPAPQPPPLQPGLSARRLWTFDPLSIAREHAPALTPLNAPPPPPITPLVAALGHPDARGRSRGANPGLRTPTPSPTPVPTPTPTPTGTGPFQLGGLCNCCNKPQCDCNTTICVQGCGGATIPTAAITVVDGLGHTVGTCVTPQKSGCCTFCLPGGAGAYTVSVAAAGYNPSGGSYSLACGGKTTITLTPTGATPPCYLFHVTGCCGIALADATITVDGTTLTIDANGEAIWCAPGPGTYPYTIDACHFDTFSGTIVVVDCSYVGNTIVVALTPIAGYVCGFNGPYPTGPTLNLTDSIWGSCPLDYDVISGCYNGSIPGLSYPADADGFCPDSPGWTLSYALCAPAYPRTCLGPFLTGSYSTAFCGVVDAHNYAWDGGLVPSDTMGACRPGVDGDPTLVSPCPPDCPPGCLSSGGATFPILVADLGQCPMDATISFPALPPCVPEGTPHDYVCSCCGPLPVARNCCGYAPWGAGGTITITE